MVYGLVSEGPPYQCEVKVGGIRYGSGGGANKKIAKLSAGESGCYALEEIA